MKTPCYFEPQLFGPKLAVLPRASTPSPPAKPQRPKTTPNPPNHPSPKRAKMTRLNEKPVLIFTAKSLSANRGPNSQYWQPPSPPAHPRSPSTPKLPHMSEIVVFQTRIPSILNPQSHCVFLVTHTPQLSTTKRNQGGACIVSVTADVCRRLPTPHSPHNPPN